MTEARSGWPPNDEDPEVGQSGWPPEDEYLEETQSPRVELADAVTRLQNSGQNLDTAVPDGRRCQLRPRMGLDLRRRQYPCMQGRPVGTNIGMCLRL